MYFNNVKKDTNIDYELKDNKSKSLKIINKYIIYLIIILIIIVAIVLLINKKEDKAQTYLVLTGDENITLYLGTDYTEIGYKAYNSKNENLTSQVKIESNLNINKIGEYEIKYSIGKITKTRKIEIIEKPEEYTYIYLNAINNDINIYLKVGESYKEPGYQVFNSEGKNLNNEVIITGSVDTNKKGNYKLTYTLVDSNGVTITKSRIVYVMDTEINLTLNTTELTNNDIVINIDIIDDLFDYMILPDGKKVNNNKHTYKVTENGKYTFKTYNKKGLEKESSIEVSNIDKISPTGTCSGSYRNGKSTININAKDNIAIEKYKINNKDYSNNKITLNEEIEKVKIKIFDKAGNIKEISCNLEKEINELDKIYTESNSHTNSINNVRYLLYNQTDKRWSSVLYPSGSTIGEIGCMISSVAVVSSAYDETVTPKTVFDKYRHSYPYNSINKLAGEGFECKQISASNSKDKIISTLKEGNVGVIMVYGKEKGGTSRFTSSQHYMALIDYKDNKIFVGNSYSSSGYGKSGWYQQDEVLTSIREVNLCTPKQSLIDKFNK